MAPRPPPLEGVDLDSALYALEASSANEREDGAATAAASSKATRSQELDAAKRAESEALAAQSHASKWGGIAGTLSTIATCVGVAAAAASVVATGGASTFAIIALAGTLSSASSPLVAKECGGTAGEVAMWGGALASLVGGGGELIAGGAAAQTGTSKLAVTVAKMLPWIRAAEGGFQISQGAAGTAAKHYAGNAQDDDASSVEHRAQMKRAQEDVDRVVDQLRDLEASMTRAASTIMQIGAEQRNTKAMLVAQIGRS